LGNFIFDMYFSKETQEGLAVGLEIWPEKVIYRLFPIKSEMSQPFLMEQKEAKKFLEELAQKSDKDLDKQIKNGLIETAVNYSQIKKPVAKDTKESKINKEKIAKDILSPIVNYDPDSDPEGQLVHHLFDINYIPSPKGAAFSPDGKEIWVASLLNKKRGVSVFDSKTGKMITNINLNNGGGVEIIFSKDGSKVYVSQMETAKVFEIDAKSKKVLASFDTKSSWTKVLALSSDGKTLYASNWVGDNISEIDLISGKLKRLIATVDTPRGIYLTEDNILYVAGFGKGEIEKINLKTGESKVIFKSGGAMRHIVADEGREILYLSDMAKGIVWQVSLKNDLVKKFAETDTNPNTIALSPDKKILFVSCRGRNYSAENYFLPGPEWGSVLLFDTETGKMLDAIVAGNQPTALAVSPDGKLLVFSDFLDNRLEVFEVPSYEKLKQGEGGRSKVYKKELKK
jgi:DNA-binding beta-propeller fold protein YncE